MNRCCVNWQEITDSIEVTPRDLYNPEEVYKGQCVEKLLKYMVGNFCPTCGKQLRKEVIGKTLIGAVCSCCDGQIGTNGRCVVCGAPKREVMK